MGSGPVPAPVLENCSQPGAASPSGAGENSIDLGDVEHSEHGGLLDRATEGALANDPSDIDDGAGRGRGGNASVTPRFSWRRSRHEPAADSSDLATRLNRGDHVDLNGLKLP